jgi:hypothetical protein
MAEQEILRLVKAPCGLGNGGVSRARFGVSPKRTWSELYNASRLETDGEVRDREDALASTRDACATQIRPQRKMESAG